MTKSELFREALREYMKRKRWEKIREYGARKAVELGIKNEKDIELSGHDRLTTTELYLNLSPEDAIREFLNKW